MAFQPPPGSRTRPAPRTATVTPIWHAQCQLDQKGNPIPNLANTCTALEQDPAWSGKLHFDEMRYCPLLNDVIVDDHIVVGVQRTMQLKGLRRVAKGTVEDAILEVSLHNKIHRLRDWLTGLQWDGGKRLNSWLHHCLGTPDNEYYQEISAMFLISMVARIFEPGCKADHMLVLEGPQRILKSSLCRALASDQYFSDTLPDLSTDAIRVSMHLRGKWIIEVSELSSFNKSDATRLKSFLTTQVEQYTPKFYHHEVREPRQCLFIGTTNDKQYLRDPTGARRYWPVECGKIDLEQLEQDREQLFAEAVTRYRQPSNWWPEPDFEDRVIKPVQDSRYQGDVWETVIADWDFTDAERDAHGKPLYEIEEVLGIKRRTDQAKRRTLSPPFYLIDIAAGALHFDRVRLGRREELRLIAVLESLGWTRENRDKRGVPWSPPPQPPVNVGF